MAITPQDLKQQRKESSGGFHLFSALIFLMFGILLILKLLNFDYPLFGFIPDKVLYWIVAVGCTFGGLYMIYKGFIWRKKIIVT